MPRFIKGLAFLFFSRQKKSQLEGWQLSTRLYLLRDVAEITAGSFCQPEYWH